MYQRKTRDEWEVQGNYGQGWECVCAEDRYREAREQFETYQANEPQYRHRIKRVRVPLEAQIAS